MIEVGEYVRTKKKGIFKVLSIRKTPYGYYCGTVDNDNIRTFTIGKGGNAEIKNDITKHSKNIIDLIEEGDYVNGEKIEQIENGFLWYGWSTEIDDYSTFFKEKDIETVVTKEKFASMEYKVKE